MHWIFFTPLLFLGVQPVFSQPPSPPQEATARFVGVEKPFCRALKGCKNAGVYMTLHLPEADTLKKVGVSKEVADRAELHTHRHCEGVMRMLPVSTLEAPHGTLELKPGGLHIMLMDLKKELKEEETLTLSLYFEKAGCVLVKVPVRTAGWKKRSEPASSTKKACSQCAAE